MNVARTCSRQLRLSGYKFVFNHPPCAVQYVPCRTYPTARHRQGVRGARRNEEYHSDDKVDLNIFEEDVSGNGRKRRRISEDEINQDVEDDEALEDDIMDLEKSINSFNIPDQVSDKLKRAFFTEEELERMEELGSIADEDIYPHRIIPQRAIPIQAQLHVKKMNEALDEVSTGRAKDQHHANVWRWYTRCKINVPGFTQMISKQAWDLIHESQISGQDENPDRIPRLAMIAQDKKDAGWQLTQEEKYAQIEGTFLVDNQREALQLFEELLTSEGAKDSKLLEMGVRMYAIHGDPERANKFARQLFELDNGADPRILLSLIRAYADRRDEASVMTAWTLFQDLKQRLSTDMQMSEYDAVVLSFLDSGQKDLALAVFRDMMLRGEHERRASGQGAFSKLANFLDVTRSPQETTDLSLDAIKQLPRKYQNKWFYASWLRKLISEGQVNAAAQVVELMYERGVKPDARHMNGLMAAWLRDQRASQKRRAEELGWTMIQRRIDLVQQRRQSLPEGPSSPDAIRPLSVNHDPQVPVPVSVSRPVPPATIETFCILLQHYNRRFLYSHIKLLQDLLDPAQLQINTMFMNQLLTVDLRTGGHRSAWERFQKMSQSIKPDLETWGTLWQCEKNHVHNSRNLDLRGFPVPRDLLRRMLDWFGSLQGHERTHAQEDIDGDFYYGIVHAFCLHHDLEGTFVAMHIMYGICGITPTEPIVRAILNMLTKLLPVHLANKEKKKFPRRQRKSKKYGVEHEREMVAATWLLNSVRQHRLVEMAGEGVEFDDLSEEARAEENHKICLAMLARIMQERSTRGAKSEMKNEDSKAIQNAAEECGVGSIDVEEALTIDIRLLR